MPKKSSKINQTIKKIDKPVLKRKRLKPKFGVNQATSEANSFENVNTEDYTKLSFDVQNEAYAVIKQLFVNLRENQAYMDEQSFNDAYASLFFELLNIAVTGNVAAMDYLCYIYKKGIDGMLYPNLTLAHKWGMLAIENGSKLSIERLRMFLTPVYDYLDEHDLDVDKMVKEYDIDKEDAISFVSQTFAGMYNPKMNITPLALAKEDPTSFETNFTKFNIEASKKRESVLPELLKYLS